MPLYPLQKIRLLADNRQTYLQGVSGYNAGWVTEYETTVTPSYGQRVTARVEAHGTPHRVSFAFDHEGRVAEAACTCGRYRVGGACKHLVAALVHKYYTDMLEDAPAAPTVRRDNRPTDPLAGRLIDRYITAEALKLTANAAQSRVHLTPILQLSGVLPTLSLRVGDGHTYQVKNLKRFAADFAEGTTVTYGKELTLLHHPDSFEPTDRALLSFVLTRLAGNTDEGPLAALPLSPADFDAFFPLIENSTVLMAMGNGEQPIRTADGSPTLAVTVEIDGEGLRLVPEAVVTVSGGHQRLYVLQGGTLYRTPESYARHMEGWLQATRYAPEGFYIAPGELGGFCAGVLPVIRPHIRLEGAVDALESHRPPPLRGFIHLDKDFTGRVTAAVRFVYGDREVEPYAPIAGSTVCRDIAAELPIKLELERYFAPTPNSEGKLPFSGDDDTLYALLTEGIPALRRLAEVTLGEALDSIAPGHVAQVRFEVSLLDGLLDMAVEAPDIDPTELAGILTGYRENRPYYRLKNGQFLPLGEGAYEDLYDLTRGLGLSPKDWQKGHLTLPAYRAVYVDSVLARQPEGFAVRERLFADLVQRCRTAGEKEWPIPGGLDSTLRDYQKAGYRWLATMEELGFGGILADDMGLGKTLQIITLMLAAKDRGVTAPHLVVCPTSVVLGWQREIARFAPQLSALCVMGDAGTRRQLLETAEEYDVIITSYDILKRDVSDYSTLTFHYQVLDEAQYIKNSATQNARAVKSIRAHQRFALTGTPVENRLSELWSIFDFLMPGLLYSQQKFRARFETPILREGDDRVLERLGRLVSPFILRRLKSQVLTQLPEKTERVLPATMERAQRQVYLDSLSTLRQHLTGVGDKRLYGQNRMAVLAQLTRLRQLCCDPRLCCEGYTGGSGKLEACMELLHEAVRGGHKVLLFSQFTSMLALIKERLEQEGIFHYLLQGSTPKEQRAAMVDAFNRDDTPVFLISLKAGGVGLNLTGADMVINYDPWWNMAAQNQATDRAHRLGQQRPVQVVRLIAEDTIEERILRMQEQKWQLAKSVVDAEGPSLTAMTAHELLALLDG